MFLLREIATFFWTPSHKVCIGIKLDTSLPRSYSTASASCRLRAYDVIRSFCQDDTYHLEIYKPWKKYAAVIFLNRDKKNYYLAQKLKRQGAKIFLDVNANLFDEAIYTSGHFKELTLEYQKNFTLFCTLADAIITPSPFLKEKASILYNEKAIYIPEILSDVFFQETKVFNSKKPFTLLYIGYAAKAQQILLLKETLEKLSLSLPLHYLFICENDPNIELKNITAEFIRYDQRSVAKEALRGDLFLAPRDLTDTYNLGHSFTKIGLPMALGIPVIASPVPSYNNSPAILIDELHTWHDTIKELLSDKNHYTQVSQKGIEYCKRYFSETSVKTQYLELFQRFIKEI